ncbi:MAG: SulP family inorganic anion transporter [Sphingobacteriales bacterium JAD_PAG50586_3]|nr:MAG: SulP family inorganic anion transporter [Sphingobacteriales bacterium JAD_PAG50586_3]
MSIKDKLRGSLSYDLPAALVVFLVALPLCLGIALGSKAPLFSGIIAGIVGGIIVGAISGSQLSVSGPAAGLTTIVAAAITRMPVYEAFLLAVVIAGVIQIILGNLRAGFLGDFVPSSVIKGMLAAIGLMLILKQLPHLVGYDADFMGDEEFFQPDKENTFTEILRSVNFISPGAMVIGVLAIAIQIIWEGKFFKSHKILSLIPAPLIVVVMGIVTNQILISANADMAVKPEHMVNIPVAESFAQFQSFFTLPDIKYLKNIDVWITAGTIAIVASLESLLSLEASDKLDPYKRLSPPNRELVAQGSGNIVSGMLGGLPVTAVIVRSSANINAGARTKLSAILHGVLLLVCVVFIPTVLNLIPLSALAGILIFVGFKLAKPAVFKEVFKRGWPQFVPFVVTVVAILGTDLLIGIFIGIGVALFYLIRSNYRQAVLVINDGDSYLMRFRSEVSFLNKSYVRNWLESIPPRSHVLIDASQSHYIDNDIIQDVHDFLEHAHLKEISVEFKKSKNGKDHFGKAKNDEE